MRLGLNPVAQGTLALSAAMLWAGSASAQCNTTCPGGAIQQNDACGGIDPDPNGGCNFDPANYQDVGAVSFGSPINICGTVGTFGANNRDLDWYTFTLAVPSRVQVTMNHKDALGNPLPNATIFIVQGSDCDTQVTLFAAASATCPFVSDEIALPAGEHVVIFTVNSFAPDAPGCPNNYVGTITVTEELPDACGALTSDCATESAQPGCSDIACCADVCAVFGSCCDTAWDALCVEVAIDVCGLFIWECNPGPGAPANDCADSGTAATYNTPYVFDTTNANTDGPTNEPCDQSNDIWYLVQAEDDGELQIDVTSPSFDSTIGIYAVGASPNFNPDFLPDFFIGCVDILGAGGEVAVLIDAADQEYYLVRIAGFQGTFGEGEVEFSFRRVVYNTGNTEAVNFSAANNGVYTLTNLGWSSGNLNAANPQRWAAQAFVIDTPGVDLVWNLTSIHTYGFSAQGALNETLHYGIWNRTGVADPDGETQIFTGSVPFPAPIDIIGGGANEDHEIDLTASPLEIEPGDYWLTTYAGNTTGGVTPANFAWFTNAQEGIPNLDPVTGTPRMWRSQMWPAPGFLVYTLPATTLQQQDGLDPNNVYNSGFRILGVKAEAPPPACPADLSGDGQVDGADLGLLIAAWCQVGVCNPSPADLNDDGFVDGADLGLLTAAWGPCPD